MLLADEGLIGSKKPKYFEGLLTSDEENSVLGDNDDETQDPETNFSRLLPPRSPTALQAGGRRHLLDLPRLMPRLHVTPCTRAIGSASACRPVPARASANGQRLPSKN
ncbi:unnamed protein product [Pylaiella littoralis]